MIGSGMVVPMAFIMDYLLLANFWREFQPNVYIRRERKTFCENSKSTISKLAVLWVFHKIRKESASIIILLLIWKIGGEENSYLFLQMSWSIGKLPAEDMLEKTARACFYCKPSHRKVQTRATSHQQWFLQSSELRFDIYGTESKYMYSFLLWESTEAFITASLQFEKRNTLAGRLWPFML